MATSVVAPPAWTTTTVGGERHREVDVDPGRRQEALDVGVVERLDAQDVRPGDSPAIANAPSAVSV